MFSLQKSKSTDTSNTNTLQKWQTFHDRLNVLESKTAFLSKATFSDPRDWKTESMDIMKI